MTRVLIRVFVLLLFCLKINAESIYITGSIESKNTQHVLMPLVPSFQGKISEMVEEGTLVKKGDFLMKVDGSSIDSQINSQIEQLQVFKATAKKDKINLEIQLNNTNISFETASTNFEIAKIKAETPLKFIGELAYKQNQLALKNTEKAFKKSKNDLQEVKVKIANNTHEVSLGVEQKQNKLDYLQETLRLFSINAEQEGYVIYATQPWSGEKIQIGDQMNSGREVLSVSKNNALQIVAWVNAIDVPKLNNQQMVNIQFDAYLGKSYRGKIIHIASGGEDKQIWGDALYYKTLIAIIDVAPKNLLLGMSALIEVTINEDKHE